jgi:hypothetical protein
VHDLALHRLRHGRSLRRLLPRGRMSAALGEGRGEQGAGRQYQRVPAQTPRPRRRAPHIGVRPTGRHNRRRACRASCRCAPRRAAAARRPQVIGVGTLHAPTPRSQPRPGGRR